MTAMNEERVGLKPVANRAAGAAAFTKCAHGLLSGTPVMNSETVPRSPGGLLAFAPRGTFEIAGAQVSGKHLHSGAANSPLGRKAEPVEGGRSADRRST